MKNNDIKVLSTTYPSEPLPFNEWIKFVHKSSEQNAKLQMSGNTTDQPANFNQWAYQIHNAKN